ncbi:MAG: bifunctional 5,10-methylenetetrahydrofolate dehydrogenase/5,10-methenyltetrahydrofolate cyclohydrolase [Oscillospiraceae bacterium]|jgi:methylenetetrahydrofolate dehydrogenase (NADP+)/methenyltetrahydrofolate cyclohydrolase|nr:bifunctional 5,10-methylenetetrahydrofolate dehydrogenase/5,10-methenyltetrahydrofolate cyclohydrolase [Oscillospiraceae bacterium]
MAKRFDGREVSLALQAELRARVEQDRLRYVFPVLATIRIGAIPAAISYEKGLMRAAEATGVIVRRYILPADTTQEDIAYLIEEINRDPLLSALLLFRPLPEGFDDSKLTAMIAPQKDIDCANWAHLAQFIPCTAEACMQLLKHYGVDCQGKHAVVLGRSRTVGLPTAKELLDANATVTVCQSLTPNPAIYARQADILIAAVGRPGLVTRDFVKPGAVILDVGINRDPVTGTLCGDVCADEVEDLAAGLSPVPYGVGSVTSTILMRHVIEAAERAAK